MKKIYKIVTDVQGGEDLTKCQQLYDGKGYGTIYSDYNGEAVIDYLRYIDDDLETELDDLTDEEPRWCKNGTDHVHSKDGYTLIYNSTIGGVFMLYREATDSEKSMLNDR